MARRGKVPSLISAHGAVKFATSGKKSPCKRCREDLVKGETCVRVGEAGGQGHRTYCLTCFSDVVTQTQTDLDRLREEMASKRGAP